MGAHDHRGRRVTERLLTTRQLADVLGFAAGTVVDWAEAEKIPAFKIGGRLRFRLSEVEAWLRNRRGPGISPALRAETR